ncbi:MAG TPA: hypothetical protein VHK91_12350 [Flavisolibacter sp.]|nr:hypothetical protein [Flavisolibacter sp.]
MKSIVPCLLLILALNQGQTQNLARIDQVKDGYGSYSTYVGEVANGVPNGIGILHYKPENTAAFYAGYFEKGVFSGKGVLYFKNGNFVSGDWKNGLLNGKGASLGSDGIFYSGFYVNGQKHGAGQLFYKDNGMLAGTFANDQFNGRCLFISAAGKNLTDNIYRNNKKNGSGYQYESESKKLFEGVWTNGDWQQASPASYTSFIRNSSFYALSTDRLTLMGVINKDSLLQDSGFYLNRVNNIRYLGRFENGHFRDGMVSIGDSLRFSGKMNDKGADGYATVYKVKRFYNEGYFKDDFLNGGKCISLNLESGDLALGSFESGKLHGKGIYVASDKSMYVGDFSNGSFSGSGYRIMPDGTFIKGTWQQSYPATITQIQKGSGEAVVLNPGSLPEAIALLKGYYDSNYDFITGVNVSDDEKAKLDGNSEVNFMNYAIFKVPGSLENYRITDYDDEEIFESLMLKTNDLNKAVGRYSEICKELDGLKVVVGPGTASQTLMGSRTEVVKTDPNTVSLFSLSEDKRNFKIGVVLKKTALDYRVYLVFGPRSVVLDWADIK